MNHKAPTENKVTLIEHIYAFIDSKLQFINYQIETAVKSFEVKDSITSLRLKTRHSQPSNRFEEVLKDIEGHSRTKAKLLLLRSKLGQHNAELSFELLTDNKYMYYSEKRLTSMLDKVKTVETEDGTTEETA